MDAYPECGASVVGFRYCSDLHLTRSITAVKTRQGEDAKYVVGRPYRARAKLCAADGRCYWHGICVPRGYRTDLASVPRGARMFVARAGPHLEACVVRDWLYEAWIAMGVPPVAWMKVFADDVLRAAMREAKVRRHTSRAIYLACSRFGGQDFKREWRHGDLPSPNHIISA